MRKLKILFIALFAMTLSCETDSVDESNEQLNIAPQISYAHVTNSVFVSSNTSGMLSSFNINSDADNLGRRDFSLPYADADGIVYDGKRNALYHVNRSMPKLVALPEISTYVDGDAITPSAVGPGTISNGREATMYNNKVVVADDVTPGRLVSYHVNTDNISDFRQIQTNIELWGIQSVGKDLFAVEDVSNNLHVFRDFFKAKTGDLNSSASVSIENLVRTHGLNYDESNDVMVLTDIGAASSPDDGALVIITDFKSKFNAAGDGGTISASDQIRIEGASTELGNPVDVNISVDRNSIFVAERANGGGKLLVFDYPSNGGDIAPRTSILVAGASAVETDF